MPTNYAVNDSQNENSPVHQWARIWNILSAIMLSICTIVAVLDGSLSAANRLVCLGFAILYGLWYWFFVVNLQRWGRKSLLLAGSFAVMILLLAVMSGMNVVYLMMFFSLYGILFGVLEIRLAIGLVLFLSVVGAARIIIGNHMSLQGAMGVIAGFGLSTFLGVTLGLFINAIITQSGERQRMIQELQATRAELARAERQAGILEERQRLAREIHDTLAQGFTSIVMHLEAAEQVMPGDEPSPEWRKVQAHLDRARRTARESLTEARRFVWALHNQPQDRASLVELIRHVAVNWSEESGVAVQVEVSGEERLLPLQYDVTLLRSAQEALANVRKHARAAQVTMTLSYMDDQVIMDIQDDGQGFDLSEESGNHSAEGNGFGLIGMRERVEQLGGSLIIESSVGEGTTLVIDLPFVIPDSPATEEGLL